MKKLLTITFFMLFMNCENNSNKEANNIKDKTLINESVKEKTRIRIYQDKNRVVGYNAFYVQLKDLSTDKIVTQATVSGSPLMQMPMMMHAAPIENPAEVAIDGLYQVNVSFIMAGMWKFNVTYVNHSNQDEGTINLEFDVAASNMVKNVTGSDNNTYFITMIYNKLNVGMNDIEFLVNRRESMMSFPAIDDLSIEMEPTMPSMGHGSPNNVNPTHFENGHYKGKINFSMTGVWKIDLSVSDNDSLNISTDFEISL